MVNLEKKYASVFVFLFYFNDACITYIVERILSWESKTKKGILVSR